MSSRVLDKPLVLRLIGVILLAHLAFAGVRLTLTLWAVDRGMSPLAVGLLLSALMIMPMFTSVAMGRWSDRAGFRSPVRLGLWMILVGALLTAWVPHLLVLVTGIVLVGWGMTMTQVAASQAIAQAAGPQGVTWGFSGLSVGFSSSGFLGPLIAGLMIDRIGHTLTFLVLSLVLPVALWVLRAIDSPLLAPVPRSSEPEPGSAHRGSLLAVRPIRAALITASLVALSWDLFNFFMPVHAAALGFSASAIGMIVAAYSAGSLTVRLVLGRLPAHISPARVLAAALLLTALVYALTPLATGFVPLLLLGLVTGLILGVGQPLAMSLLHQNAPAGRAGEAIGMRSVIVSASQTFLPAVFGAMGSAFGTGPVFWVVAGIIVLALAVVRPAAARP